MSHSSNSGDGPEFKPRKRSRWAFVRRTAIGLSFIMAAGLAGGAWWAWLYIHERLAPQVAQSLSELMNRPVEVGPVEQVSLSQLTFGTSGVPATATDPDRLTIDTIQINFNLLEVIASRTLSLNITLRQVDGYIVQEPNGRWVATEFQPQEREGPIATEVNQVRILGGQVVMLPYLEDENRPGTPIPLEQIRGEVNLQQENQQIRFEVAGQARDGRVAAEGELFRPLQALRVMIQAQNLQARDVDQIVQLPALQFDGGRISGNLIVTERPDQPFGLQGTLQAQAVDFQIEQVPKPFTQATGLIRFQGQQIGFDDVALNYGQIPGVVAGAIDLQTGYALEGQVAAVSADAFQETLEVEFPFPVTGILQADITLGGALDQPRLAGQARTVGVAQVDRLDLATAQTDFLFDGQAVTFDNIAASPVAGGQITGSGQLKIGEEGGLVFDLQGDNLPGNAIAQEYGVDSEAVTFGPVDVNVQLFGPYGGLQTVVAWQAPQATYPGQGEVVISGETTRLQRTTLQVAGGNVALEALLGAGQWQAEVEGAGIQLSQFSPELQGTVQGDLQLSGSLENFSPSTVRAEGIVGFSSGVASFSDVVANLNQPLTAAVRWDGEKIIVEQARAEGLQAEGLIFVDLEGAEAPALERLDLNVVAQNYDLDALPGNLPPALQIAGTADFAGQITGAPPELSLIGDLQLNQLNVNNIAFEPSLQGDFSYVPNQGLTLNVSGTRDQVALAIDAENRPQFFEVRLDDAIAQGRTEGDLLQVDVANLPLGRLNLPGVAQLGAPQGQLDADLTVDLTDYSLVGQVAIANPSIGYIRGDRFTGDIRYVDGIASLTAGDLQLGNSRYLLEGNFTPGPDPTFDAEIILAQAELQDLLSTFQIFDIQDFARGLQPPTFDGSEILDTTTVGLPNAPLITQLRRFSEIQELLAQQMAEREAASFLPPLSNLTGSLTGEISIAGSLQQGIRTEFDLQGQDWQWDEYSVNQVIASGNYENGVLTLLPFRVTGDDDLLLAFSGQIGGEQQSGQLRAQNLPLEAIENFVDVPVALAGDLSTTATLGGSIENPQVVGELILQNGFINGTAIETAQGRFNYADARFNALSSLIVEGPEPVTLQASIPYSFPFMAVEPDSDRILVEANVRDEGLSLLNVLNRQVAWESGEGEVQLRVTGTLSNPLAQGIARLNGATLQAQILPEPLTDVTGEVRFNRDRIIVDGLQGQFSQGQVVAQGVIPLVLPLSGSDPDRDTPLTVALDNIELNLKGIYSGDVDGQVSVTGSALAPEIGGSILLSDGRVSLPEGAEEGGTTPVANPDDMGTPVQFDNLTLVLGNNVQVTREPILTFLAEGDLTLNGTLDDIRPQGVIELQRGQVNLFTTRFRLARGYPQTAVFRPDRGLDPILDVRLATNVTEVSRAPIPSLAPLSSSEIQDLPPSAVGELQTVRISATVQGPASELFNNLELSSSPSRSETEIIALIGGGFVDTLGRGDSTLALANLAGSTLLGNIQALIGDAVGLSEFRLFPTYTTIDEDGTTALGIGAELGVDVTEDVSVSVLQMLTESTQPTRFNVRYRLNDEFLLRGSTNFSGRDSMVLEYQTRF